MPPAPFPQAPFIDLRSDTMTRPTAAMRQEIAQAEVGDDMSGEDPSANRLEAKVAEIFGKEAAVYASSGTQSNQMALWAQCNSGDDILIEESGHIGHYEGGAPATLSGISLRTIAGRGGLFDLANLEGKNLPPSINYPETKLLCVENTTNLGGGRVWPLEQMERVANWAHNHGMKVHVDGARIFNAAIAGGYSVREFAAFADTVSVCFSKGLGCPMGSAVVGSKSVVARARRARKLFGGALRQIGMMAASAEYALDNHIERLADDHANARLLGELLEGIPFLYINRHLIETNLVFFDIDPEIGTGAEIAARLAERGVRLLALGPQRLRAVTHLDVTRKDILAAAKVIGEVCQRPGRARVGGMATY